MFLVPIFFPKRCCFPTTANSVVVVAIAIIIRKSIDSKPIMEEVKEGEKRPRTCLEKEPKASLDEGNKGHAVTTTCLNSTKSRYNYTSAQRSGNSGENGSIVSLVLGQFVGHRCPSLPLNLGVISCLPSDVVPTSFLLLLAYILRIAGV